MQLSDFQMITTDEKKRATSTPWDKSMAVALSHCSRVVLTLPKQDAGDNNVLYQLNMWKAIYTVNGSNTAEDNSRASSTHSIKRRKVSEKGIMRSKEKKVLFNLIGQRGMNCAIGGLGNAGVSGKTIANDGSCGYFYSNWNKWSGHGSITICGKCSSGSVFRRNCAGDPCTDGVFCGISEKAASCKSVYRTDACSAGSDKMILP